MSENIFTLSNGKKIPIVCTFRRGSRNIILRPKIIPTMEIRVSLPKFCSVSDGLRFIQERNNWLEKVFSKTPEKIKIKNDDVICFLGKNVIVKYDQSQKTNCYISDCENILIIGGSLPEMFESRIREFIKAEFLSEIKKIIQTVPQNFRPKKIAIRDTTSCWGSCSSTGTLSFSWRLAFAPPEVMRYVVMHELAHKKHMDHSPAFWAQVSSLYGEGVGRAKLWLSEHGNELHKYF